MKKLNKKFESNIQFFNKDVKVVGYVNTYTKEGNSIQGFLSLTLFSLTEKNDKGNEKALASFNDMTIHLNKKDELYIKEPTKPYEKNGKTEYPSTYFLPYSFKDEIVKLIESK